MAMAENMTRVLVDAAATLGYEDVPDDVLHEAKRALADWTAAALAGSTHPEAALLFQVLGASAAGRGYSAIGNPGRLSQRDAALLNGFQGHVMDFDDTYNPAGTTIHGSSPLWPTIGALSEGTTGPITGRAALVAFIAAFEAECQIALCAGPAHYEAGWHVTGTVGHLGAAVAAARLLGQSPAEMERSLGCAAAQSAGIKGSYGTAGKALHAGKAAADGLLAAQMVNAGISGPTGILEREWGFLPVFAPDYDVAPILARDPSFWHLGRNSYKPYPSGSLTHASIDAALEIRQRLGGGAPNLKRIEVRAHPYATTVTGKPNPTTGLEAKFSLSHAVAVTLLHGTPGSSAFSDEMAVDADVAAMRREVDIVSDSDIPKRGATLVVVTSDDVTLTSEIAEVRGGPDNQMSDDDLGNKVLAAAEGILPARVASQVVDMCFELEKIDDFSDFVGLISEVVAR